MSGITVKALQAAKRSGDKIVALTVYDAGFARCLDAAGVEVMLVGDTLGMVVQGYASTVPVTIDQMVYHIGNVVRAQPKALVIGDMPFNSYATPEQALVNAGRLIQAGAAMVKMEGGAWLTETVVQLHRVGIPVCGHVGLTPQSVNTLGGYRVQGKQSDEAAQVVADALALEAAGAQLLVVECVPTALGQELSASLSIPVIGIGAGPDTDGQILVLYDMLGVEPNTSYRFVRCFLDKDSPSVLSAVQCYVNAVKASEFPGPEHSYGGICQ